MGRQRLHADLRRLPAARRPAWPTCSGAAGCSCSAWCCSRLASFAGGIAQSEGWLLAARAAQGLGAAIVSPAALSIITITFAEGAERNRALGIWGAVVGAGRRRRRAARRDPHQRPELALGAVRQRPDRDRRGGARAADAASRAAPRTERARSIFPARSPSPQACRCSSTRSSTPSTSAGDPRRRWPRIAGAVVLLAAFLIIERRERHPLMPFSIFRLRTLRGADIVGLLHRHVAVLDVLLHLAVPPERAALLADQDGRLVPAARGRDHPRGGGCLTARHAHRLQAGADRRAAAHRRRPALVLAGARPRRLLPRRRARPVAAGRRPGSGSRSCPSRSPR